VLKAHPIPRLHISGHGFNCDGIRNPIWRAQPIVAAAAAHPLRRRGSIRSDLSASPLQR
jgi:hypothetical protein